VVSVTLSMLDRFAGASGETVRIEGWMSPFQPGSAHRYFALVEEPPCCLGCLPREANRRIEVFAEQPIPVTARPLQLRGRLYALTDDPADWRFQLREAGLAFPGLSRRHVLAASLACVAVTNPAARAAPPSVPQPQTDAQTDEAARAVLADLATVDIHTHAGGVIGKRRVEQQLGFTPVAAPMQDGGMAVLCLAAVPDTPTHRIMDDHRIHPFRDPDPGELYAYGQLSFQRLHALAAAENLAIINDAAGLARARSHQPSVIISSEGGDFLEGQIERVGEAYSRWSLRHLQLTHYRVNELGDIQTEAPVHGGLTPFGADVIRQCNRMGIVVDVAHGPYDLVKQAAAVTTKPLVLSHTALSDQPGARSRLISADHAWVIAGTGGVIGIWPPLRSFPDMPALAAGMARMVDAVGIDHVGLGTDMGGLVGPALFASYRDLPALTTALLGHGFQPGEVRKLLAENYLRVFTASLA
jgi:membrane dipeptidase